MEYSIKSVALFFIALGVGYMICVSASKEKGFLKNLGYLIGAAILAGSLLATASRIGLVNQCTMSKGNMTCGYAVPPVK